MPSNTGAPPARVTTYWDYLAKGTIDTFNGLLRRTESALRRGEDFEVARQRLTNFGQKNLPDDPLEGAAVTAALHLYSTLPAATIEELVLSGTCSTAQAPTKEPAAPRSEAATAQTVVPHGEKMPCAQLGAMGEVDATDRGTVTAEMRSPERSCPIGSTTKNLHAFFAADVTCSSAQTHFGGGDNSSSGESSTATVSFQAPPSRACSPNALASPNGGVPDATALRLSAGGGPPSAFSQMKMAYNTWTPSCFGGSSLMVEESAYASSSNDNAVGNATIRERCIKLANNDAASESSSVGLPVAWERDVMESAIAANLLGVPDPFVYQTDNDTGIITDNVLDADATSTSAFKLDLEARAPASAEAPAAKHPAAAATSEFYMLQRSRACDNPSTMSAVSGLFNFLREGDAPACVNTTSTEEDTGKHDATLANGDTSDHRFPVSNYALVNDASPADVLGLTAALARSSASDPNVSALTRCSSTPGCASKRSLLDLSDVADSGNFLMGGRLDSGEERFAERGGRGFIWKTGEEEQRSRAENSANKKARTIDTTFATSAEARFVGKGPP